MANELHRLGAPGLTTLYAIVLDQSHQAFQVDGLNPDTWQPFPSPASHDDFDVPLDNEIVLDAATSLYTGDLPSVLNADNSWEFLVYDDIASKNLLEKSKTIGSVTVDVDVTAARPKRQRIVIGVDGSDWQVYYDDDTVTVSEAFRLTNATSPQDKVEDTAAYLAAGGT